MTAERSQDFALVALVVSIAVHVGLMYYMRPQVMAQVSSTSHHARSRGPMEMRERPPEAEAVHIDVLKDLDAFRDAPEPQAEGPAPVPADFGEDDSLSGRALAPELNIATLSIPVPEVETAPPLSEKFELETPVETFLTPIVPERGMEQAAVAAAEAPVAPVEPEDAPDILVPEFDAPELPEVAAAESQDAVPELAKLDDGRPVADFKPVSDVMPSVDERVVEAEKQAVRDLLDVRGATELATFVALSADSAQEGEWTYFRVKVSPDAGLPTVAKDVVVLMDASGSIGNDRLESCRNAARRILRSCTNTGDRFNLVAFRDKFSYAFKSWQECNADSFAQADKWLNKLAAHGRTDVFATIRSVLTLPRDPARPLIAMVVTDGDANAGVSATAQILSRFTELNDGLVSVYMYGVKASANRELIDVLTHGNRGESFIYGGSRWNAGSAIETLAERFRDPVLSDLRVVFATGTVAETYPARLRNLYRGESVEFVGRVPAGTREVSFSLKGLNGSIPYEGFFTVSLGESSFDSALPGSWRDEQQIDSKLK